MQTNVLIADDHSIVRYGIKSLLRRHFDFDTINEAEDEDEITIQVKAMFYKLMVLDIGIPGSDFVGLMNWLRNTSPETAIIVFTTYPEDIYAERCLQLGARGFLSKTAPDAEIIYAVRDVQNGGTYINPRAKNVEGSQAIGNKADNPFEKLSDRELEIAHLINGGHKLPDICEILHIQYSTANTYKRRIFEKLNVHNAVSLSHLMQTFGMAR